MKIGINGTPLFGHRGIRRYTEQLIKHLALLDKESHYFIFYICFRHGRDKMPSLSHAGRMRNIRCRIPGKIYEPLSHTIGFPSIDFFTGALDVFHNTEENPYACRGSVYLQTIHGLHHKMIPRMLNPAYAQNQEKYFNLMLKRSHYFATVSETVKKELMECYSIPSGKIYVVYPGIEEHFRVIEEKDAVRKFLKEKFSLDEPYVLYVGGLDEHKNLLRVLDAYTLCVKQKAFDGKLVLVGPTEKRMSAYFQKLLDKIQQENLSEKITILGYVDEESLVRLYNAACVFVHPSFYEGCTVSPLEAMACGCPVITSSISSMPETTGGVALTVNPSSVEEICDAMKKIIHEKETQYRLKAKGLKWVSQFNYKKMAAHFLSIYKEIYQQKN